MKLRFYLTTVSLIPASLIVASCSSTGSSAPDPAAQDPGLAVATQADDPVQGPHVNAVTEAPQGFDGQPNGNCTPAQMRTAGPTVPEGATFRDGLGPAFHNTPRINRPPRPPPP